MADSTRTCTSPSTASLPAFHFRPLQVSPKSFSYPIVLAGASHVRSVRDHLLLFWALIWDRKAHEMQCQLAVHSSVHRDVTRLYRSRTDTFQAYLASSLEWMPITLLEYCSKDAVFGTSLRAWRHLPVYVPQAKQTLRPLLAEVLHRHLLGCTLFPYPCRCALLLYPL